MRRKVMVLTCLLALFYSENETRAAEAICTATIMPAISTTKTSDLVFGVILPSETLGTVTITPLSTEASERTHSGGVQLVASTSGAASFNVSGATNTSFTVTFDNSAINITNGADTMTVRSFTIYPPSGTTKLNNDGLATFNVGGTLDVGENQPPGNYSGSFTVNVAYQ